MNSIEQTSLLIEVFLYLRRSGIVLGVDELQDGLKTARRWHSESTEKLKLRIRLVWCHSPSEESIFNDIWETVTVDFNKTATGTAEDQKSVSRTKSSPSAEAEERATEISLSSEVEEPSLQSAATFSEEAEEPSLQSAATFSEEAEERAIKPSLSSEVKGPSLQSAATWEPLPFYVPFTPVPIGEHFELASYWPISRRQMIYAWRYMRRPIADGPRDVLDVAATIADTTKQGIFLGPSYRRRVRNHVHLMLLIDQNGSMMPFHRFTRDLVTTALYESSIEQVDVYYFHNVPVENVYTDPHMLDPVKLANVLSICTSETSVLITSDAGAARGLRRAERIRASSAFLRELEQHTSLTAWLNPMPEERWSRTSAQIIAGMLQHRMFQMDPDGFSNAIDVVRGQSFRYQR